MGRSLSPCKLTCLQLSAERAPRVIEAMEQSGDVLYLCATIWSLIPNFKAFIFIRFPRLISTYCVPVPNPLS